MKRILQILLALSMAAVLTACAGGTASSGAAPPPQEQTEIPAETAPEAPTEAPTETPTETPANDLPTAVSDAETDAPAEKLPERELPTLHAAVMEEESAQTGDTALEQTQFDAIWTEIFGYWNAAEGRFVVFDAMDSHTSVLIHGIYGTSFQREGTVIAAAEHDLELTLTVLFYATEATEQQDALPEITETVLVDYSGLEQDGKIRVKIGEDDWRQYLFAGQTFAEAYQTHIQNTSAG